MTHPADRTDPAHHGRCALRMVLPIAAAAALTACDTPVGTPSARRNVGSPPIQVTNPEGGGPQVTRWGPPDTSHGGRD
jgi:hypothetical protein